MKMFIDGRWTDSSDGAVSSVINPATGVCVDTVPEATEQDVDRAIALAVEGQKEWNDIPLHEKLSILERYCVLLTENTEKSRPSCVKKAVSPLNSAARKLPPTLRSFAFIVLPHIPLREVAPIQCRASLPGGRGFYHPRAIGRICQYSPLQLPGRACGA